MEFQILPHMGHFQRGTFSNRSCVGIVPQLNAQCPSPFCLPQRPKGAWGSFAPIWLYQAMPCMSSLIPTASCTLRMVAPNHWLGHLFCAVWSCLDAGKIAGEPQNFSAQAYIFLGQASQFIGSICISSIPARVSVRFLPSNRGNPKKLRLRHCLVDPNGCCLMHIVGSWQAELGPPNQVFTWESEGFT